MTKHAKATQNVYAKIETRHRHIVRPSKCKRTWIGTPRIISFIAAFIGLTCLSSCQNKEAQKRLEMTIESQAIQMAALNDRLARCEHQWQTNTDEIMRYNEVTMRDIGAFREEQNSLRKSVFGMDERWAIQHDHLRKHNEQLQESVTKIDEDIQKTDTHLANYNEGLQESITNTHASLSTDLDDLANTSTSTQQRVVHLQSTADGISNGVTAVQEQNHALYTQASDNKEDTNQKLVVLQTSLDKAQNTADNAVNGIKTANTKHDRVLAWSQNHSQRVETIKNESDANQVASNQLISKQLNGLQRQTQVQARLDTTRHAEITDQLNTLEIQNSEIQGQISDVAQEAQTRFGGVTAYQAQLYQAMKKNDQQVGSIQRHLSSEHQNLSNQIKKVDTTTTNIAEQIQQGHQVQADSNQGLSQKVTELDRRWANTFQQRCEEEDAQTEKHQNNVTQKLESLKHQGNALGQKIDQVQYQQKKQAEGAQKERKDQAEKQTKQLDGMNQEIRQNRTQLSEEIHQAQVQTKAVSQQVQKSNQGQVESSDKLSQQINEIKLGQNQEAHAETIRHEAVTDRLQALVQQHKEFQTSLDQTAKKQQQLMQTAQSHRAELAAQDASRSQKINTTITHQSLQNSKAIKDLAQEQQLTLNALEEGQEKLHTWTQNHDALAAKNQVSTIQRYQATSRQLQDLQQQNQAIQTSLAKNAETQNDQSKQAQIHREQLAQKTGESMTRLEKGQQTFSIWTQHQNELQSQHQENGDKRDQAVTEQLAQIQKQQTELKSSLTQQQNKADDLEQARLTQLQETLVKGQKELQRDLNNVGAASATVAQGNEKANRQLDQKVTDLLTKNEQTQTRLDNIEVTRTAQFKNLENQVQQVRNTVVHESNKLQTTQKQLGIQAKQNQVQNSEQMAELTKNVGVQGQNLEKKTSGLATMNQTLLEQLTKVADSQTQFQRAVHKEQSTTNTAIETHSQNLQAQLKQLTQLLNTLEGRLDKTSQELEKSIQAGSQADQKTSKAMKQELDTLRQTVSLITNTQEVIKQQLSTLQTTVKDQHKTQTAELVEIKEKVSQAKAEETSEEGS